MALWNKNTGNPAALTPPGTGNGAMPSQFGMFAQAAADSGLTDMAMAQVDSMTGGMKNEDQVQMLYRLMAVQPNELSLFFLHYPEFMKEMAALIALIIRQELYKWFSSGAISTTLNTEKAMEYASITQENIDAQIAKVVPTAQLQAEVNQGDMQAMQMMNANQQNAMMGNMQQQQMMQQQQQWQQQQMMMQQPPQRQGLSGALGNFGSNLIRGSLVLPPAQPQMPQQQMGYGQQPMM